MATALRTLPILLDRQAHRLFHQDVLTGLGRGDGLFGVDVTGASHVHDVDLIVTEHLVVAIAERTLDAERSPGFRPGFDPHR